MFTDKKKNINPKRLNSLITTLTTSIAVCLDVTRGKRRKSYQSGIKIHLNQNNQGLRSCRVEEDQLLDSLPTQQNSRKTPHCPQLCICIEKPININLQSINPY